MTADTNPSAPLTTVRLYDPNSFWQPGQPQLQHLDLEVKPDFAARMVHGTATLIFNKGGKVFLDSRDLNIFRVTDHEGRELNFVFQPGHTPIIGDLFIVNVPADKPEVTIEYSTDPKASGLQWLKPEQTFGKNQPFLYTQGEAIHARSYVPIQDTPKIRITFGASIIVPKELRGLFAADQFVKREEVDGDTCQESWRMTKPIPPYLIAFAVGNLMSEDLSSRSRVWAEPSMLKRAAKEFEDIEKIVQAGEKLFGEYPWGRADLLVMPSAFPFGGMENPTLAFLTPSLVVGDKSMVSVVAHELAHAWTGNLVTNDNWGDFWINEGSTSYAERRIDEEVFGRDTADIERGIMEPEMQDAFERFTEEGRPWLTSLHVNTAGIDPDDVFTRIPYQKGARFFELLEDTIGREAMDSLIRDYIERFAFKTVNSASLLQFLCEMVPGITEKIRAWEWIYGQYLPDNALPHNCPSLVPVYEYAKQGQVPPSNTEWRPMQWAIFLRSFPRTKLTAEVLLQLNQTFELNNRPNTELRQQWLCATIDAGAWSKAEVNAFLGEIGRGKLVRAVFRSLARSNTLTTRVWAREKFREIRENYHQTTQAWVESEFKSAEAAGFTLSA